MFLLLIALAANLDNLGVGTAYGIARRRITPWSNFIIALMALALTFGAMACGHILETMLSASVANAVGATVIVGVGVWICWESVITHFLYNSYYRLWRSSYPVLYRFLPNWRRHIELLMPDNPSYQVAHPLSGNQLAPRNIGLQETLFLGVSLALNAMAGGLGASLSGYNPLHTSLTISGFSYLTVDIGQRLAGTYLSKRLGAIAPKVAGLILMGIGLYEFFN